MLAATPRARSGLFALALSGLPLLAQDLPFPPFPPGGPQGPGGPGGPGGMAQETAVRERFDADHDGRLDAAERQAARAWLKENRPQRGRGRGGPGGFPGGPGGFPGGPGGPGGFPGGPGGEAGGYRPAADAKGQTVRPAEVPSHPDRPPFDPTIVRTIFVDFPSDDWFAELADFYRTDVAVPATVQIDGATLREVGIGFRGNTSYMMAAGKKKSFDLAFDHGDPKQDWRGLRNLDLINCNSDPSFVRELLAGQLANRYLPAPRTALVRLVVNGEDFGAYVAVQQFDKEFVQDHFGTKQGDRFKVPPDFSGNGGLRFLGDEPQAYRRSYQLKGSSDEPAAWQALVDACAVLERTPSEDLERILPQHLDIDAMLWFLALDNALGDDDGYHARASDYLLYRDPKGRFHAIPRDNNEILLARQGGRGPGGPGGPAGGPGAAPGAPAGGPGADAGPGTPPPADRAAPGAGPQGPGNRRGGGPGGAATSPLQMASRTDRPLLKRLLEVPAWRARYLANLRELATGPLADAAIAPQLAQWHALLQPIVTADAHALYGPAAFERAFASDAFGKPAPGSLRAVIARRVQTILDDAALQGDWPVVSDLQTRALALADGTTALVVTCRTAGAPIGGVALHHDRGAFGAYSTLAMADDGRHGDGQAGDGVYGATLPPLDAGKTWRLWLEAQASSSGHVACLPPGGGALPLRWTAPRTKGKAKAK